MEDAVSSHIEHCSKCHLIDCPYQENFGCWISQCPECRCPLHECKIEDHLENLCSSVMVPCINAAFGCRKMLRRSRRTAHLAECPCSVVVCTREWSRRAISNELKFLLKQWGKGVKERPKKTEPKMEEIDVQLAESDQNLLLHSYSFSRTHRNHLRDGLNKAHPVVPLRYTDVDIGINSNVSVDQEGAGSSTATSTINITNCVKDDENSSDEEKREREKKLRKKKAMFANCYMCQIDPASQHLHTLGNDNAKYSIGRLVKKWPRRHDTLHKKYQLTISSSIDVVPENVSKSENIYVLHTGGTLYTRKCLKTVRRDEFGHHHLAQHCESQLRQDDLIVRCPNWQNGCSFTTYRLKPKNGIIRYSTVLDTLTHSPNESNQDSSTSSPSLDEIPIWILLEICAFLPSSAVRCLSQVSRNIRLTLQTYFKNRAMCILQWKKVDGVWLEKGIKYDFSVSEAPVDMVWRPPIELNNHLSNCAYFEPVEYKEERISVFDEKYKTDLATEFFEFSLSHREDYP